MQKDFIIGAAGTGKTRLLVQNITQLLQDVDIEASSIKILVLVSSLPMARKIESALKYEASVTVHTIKSLSEATLNDEYPELKIISKLKSWLILRRYIRSDSTELKSIYRLVKEKPSFVREVLELIQAAGMNSIPIDQIPNPIHTEEKLEEIKNIYSYYRDFCQLHDLVPEFQVIPKALSLLNEYCQRYSHIFIDQYEDFCPGEIQAINELTRGHNNVTIFADSVRSNLSENIDKTQTRFSNFNHINRLLGKNVYEESTMNCETTDSDINPLTIALEATAVDEAEYIGRAIKKMVNRTGRRYSDFAILCREKEKFGTVLHDVLKKYSIPCSGMSDLQNDFNVRFIMLCLQVAANPRDDDLVLKWLSSGIAKMNRVDVYRAYRYAKEKRQDFLKSLNDSIRRDSQIPLNPPLLKGETGRLAELLSILDFATREIRAGTSIQEIIEPILVNAGAIEPGKIPANVSFFIRMVQDVVESYERRPRLSAILNDVMEAMLMQFDSDAIMSEDMDTVKIMSIWESRGLEFPVVFIPGMVRDFFPARHPARQLLYGEELGSVRTALRGIDLPGTVTLDRWREQEKQLLYIAMTRAKEKLYLTLAKKYQYGEDLEPSPFIIELLGEKELSAESCSQCGITFHDYKVSNFMDKLPLPDDILTQSQMEIAFSHYIRETQQIAPKLTQEAREFLANAGVIDHIIPPEPMPEYGITNISDRKFSYSSIRSFLLCPRKYFFDNLLRIESDSIASSHFGRLIHDVLKEFHNEYPNLRDYEQEELWGSMQKILDGIWNDRIQLEFIQNRLRSRSYWGIAEDVLKKYLNGECKRWENGRVCIKTEDNFNFVFFDKYTLTGRIDRIDSCLASDNEIIDFKTSRDSDAESKLKSYFLNMDDDPDYKPQDYQLPIYYFAKSSESNLNITKLVVYQLRTYSKRDQAPFRREIGILDENTRSGKKDKFITKADLDSVKGDILETLDRMTSGYYPPEPRDDRECNMCEFGFICDREGDEG